MEAVNERVGESSSNRRTGRQYSHKSFADSSPSQSPRTTQKKRKRGREASPEETTSDIYYEIKDIVDEKIENGKKSYLIDWKDNVTTGEQYTPTWEPHDFVTKKAIKAWNKKKERRRTGQTKEVEVPRRSTGNLAQPTSSSDPESQPIRAAKRQRTNHSQSPHTSSQSFPKKPRRAGTAETARFQSASQETVNHQDKLREIKDSYEEQSVSNGSGQLRVEILVDQGFDRDAYSRVTVVSSQPSQSTQYSHISGFSQPSNTPSQSPFKSVRGQLFIWDEEDEGADSIPIIHDTHFIPGSSSYIPSETQASIAVAPESNTQESDLATSSSLARASAVAVNSIGSGSRDSELSRQPSRTSYTGGSELRSGQVGEIGPTQLHHSTPEEGSQDSNILWPSSNLKTLADSEIPGDPSSRPGTTHSASSTRIPISSVTPLPYPVRGTASAENRYLLRQEQSYQPSYPASGSSPQFQTQVRVAARDEASSPDAIIHVRSLEETQNSIDSTRSQTPGPDSLSAWSATATQLSFEAIAPPSSRIQQDELSVEQDSPSTPSNNLGLAEKLELEQSIAITADSRQIDSLEILSDSTTLKSPSKSEDHPSPEGESQSQGEQEHRLESPESENILPSIEPNNTISSPSTRPPPPTSSFPDPFFTPSPRGSKMADQAMSEISTSEKLRRARAAAAESKMAELRATRTASAIPHTPPPPPPATNQMLPLRETVQEAPVIPTTEAGTSAQSRQNPRELSAAINPEVPDSEVKASPQEEEEVARGVSLLPLGGNAFAIPLPMVSLARDIYEQEIINHQPQRRAFLNDEKIDRDLVADINKMIEHLKMICDHQDLIDASASQATDHRQQAKWAENISTKCIFLAEFFNSLKPSHSHIVLLVRPGRMMDILETVFRTNNYHYTVPTRSFSHRGQGLMGISLFPTDLGPRTFNIGPASLVIAFDSTFQRTPWVETLRTDPTDAHRIVPLAYLVITHSIEHLELCLTKNMDQLERTGVLVSWLSQTREVVGKLDVDGSSPDTAAKSLAGFIASGGTGEWPLPTMPIVEEIELPVVSARDSNIAQLSGSTTQSYDLGASALQSTFKRPLADEDNSESSKRQRLTPVGGVNSLRIDETVPGSTSNAGAEAKETREIITKAEIFDVEQGGQAVALLEKLTNLQIQLREKESTEVELREMNQRLDARCQDYEKSIAKIQPKYQEALNDRGQAAHDIQESMTRETSMRQKFDARTAELTRLKEQKALADTELAAARTALLNSSIPEVAELQKLKSELAAARADIEKAQKKIASGQNDMEFMRTNYQTASSAAAEMRNELDELKSQNAILARKASDNAVEIHRIQSESTTKQYLQLISNLEVEKAAMERELEKKSEELKSLQ
ncbi:Histone deacetylase complex 1 subunit 3, partial [Hyphodiscus hymeniophilus]